MAAIIELDDVSFSYRTDGPRALDGITLSLEEGAFLGIIGPSGAGKSTLAAVLSGAIPHHFGGPFFGSALVAGTDTCDVTLTDIARVVGSVNQDIDAQMVASVVEDELLFGLENFGAPHERIDRIVDEALAAVGIPELREREIATLSGGQKQKVAIAAILALAPRVLVLDEPTAALDPVSSRMVFDVLRELNERQGITVIVIEQSVALLSEYCERIIVMDRGRVALDGTPHEVFGHAAELRAIGVDSPRVARISNSLAAAGLCPASEPCLNVTEAEELVMRVAGPPDHAAKTRPPTPSPHAPARPAPGASPVVELARASFRYPGGGASVDELDLAVYPGEIVALVGQNGAGKTTATKLINGLLKPASGAVRVCGLDTRVTPVSVIARHAATLFQNPDHQLCKNTVLDEVAFGLELAGMDGDAARERARAVIERFGLDAAAAPFSLSRGQRQMVALASVVVTEPAVIILDEPTSGLDYRECMTVMDTVRAMAEQGSAVIMVCHDMEVVSDFAGRAAIMAEGRILACDRTERIFADDALMEAASVRPPQVIELSRRLARAGYAAFDGVSEVSVIIERAKELSTRA